MVDWKEQVLKLAKNSLKISQDLQACLYLTELKEFESYIQAEYILGVNLLNDLFSKLFAMFKAKDISESIKMSTEALNILRTIKSKNLWSKFTEEHLDKIISRCLLKRDHNEFVNEWAKKRAKAMFASEEGEETDDEDGTGIDMNKTIS